MPQHPFDQPKGRIETFRIESEALKCNVLGDPSTRDVAVYLPEGYDDTDEDYPLFVDIVGFTNSGFGHLSWKAFGESLPQRVDRLITEGKMGKVILAFPDCFTSLGGNQYVNSSAMGYWADFLTLEMAPALENHYRIRKGAVNRALFGKSSGGYGSILHGMKHAEHWGGIACHSGDMGFEVCYLNEMPKVLMHLARFGGDTGKFIDKIKTDKKMGGGDFHMLMIIAMAASYDPDPQAPYGLRLPVTKDTCELIPERWDAWLEWDPIQLIEHPTVQKNLKTLKCVYIDCGSHDQYNLVFGARRLTRRLNELAIEHHYEEFPDSHTGVDYRMDQSLPMLYKALTD